MSPRRDLVVDEQGLAGRFLGDALRTHRERLGITLSAAAQEIRASTSKVSRLERGESPAKARDVHDLALFYGLSRDEQGELDQLLTQTANAEMYARFADVTPNYLKRLIRLEAAAERICVFEPRVVPGPLQTEAYARALVRLTEVDLADGDVDRTVALRGDRQLRLERGAPAVAALMGEGVLYGAYGSPEVMVQQVEFLLRATRRDRVNIRIVRRDVVMPPHPISHLAFPHGDGRELVYTEHLDGASYVLRKSQLDRYRKVLANVRLSACDRARSVESLETALAHWKRLASR